MRDESDKESLSRDDLEALEGELLPERLSMSLINPRPDSSVDPNAAVEEPAPVEE